MLSRESVSFGYLLPTRDAVAFGRLGARDLLELGEEAERLGFEALWAGDGPLARPRHDALTILAALAGRTQSAMLATGVLLAALRPTLLLAQAVATLDQLSAGRFTLGVGAGFPLPETERQFEAVGVPFASRTARLSETIEALRALWRGGDAVDFAGTHVRLQGVTLEPRPHRPGGPPVWMAGAGERAEERVGRLADGWLPYPPHASLYAEGLARVQDAAAQADREQPHAGLYATVALDTASARARQRLERWVERYYGQPGELIGAIQASYAGTPEGMAEWLTPYIEAGARHIVLRAADEDARRGLHALAAGREAMA